MTEEGETGTKMSLDVLIHLLIGVVIFFAIFTYVQNIYTDDSFERDYIAKDLALAVDALQVPQGNTVMFYAKDTDSYSFVFKDNRVQVFSMIDQPEPPAYLRGMSVFSVDRNFEFQDSELKTTGLAISPSIIKTDNMLYAAGPEEPYNLGLYSYEDVNTSREPKDLIFTGKDNLFVEALVRHLNSALGTVFLFSTNNPRFVILKSVDENIIYSPSDLKNRKLASLIANKFMEKGHDFVILPSKDIIFTIKVEEGIATKLQIVLEESFREFYHE